MNKLLQRGIIVGIFTLFLIGCSAENKEAHSEELNAKQTPLYNYQLNTSATVNGRQGVASEGDYYWVSGSTTLAKYDKNWNLVSINEDPFSTGYELEVNHIGDIDVYNNEIYCGVELFLDGVATNIQVAVYDGTTLELKRTFNFDSESGQEECSGISVNPDNQTVLMSSWAEGESGTYLYKYDLTSGNYLGKVQLSPAPKWIQGVTYYDGYYYISADDGDADANAPDHIYRTKIADNTTKADVVLEHTLDDVILQGEVEGLTFDKAEKQFLVLYNRGARIVRGMPTGFYDGYDHEIHDVFVYDMMLPDK